MGSVIKHTIFRIPLVLLIFIVTATGEVFEKMPSDSVRIIRPKAALIRSAILPGWGHFYVHKPLKGILYFSLEAYHIYQFIKYNDIYQYVKETKETIGIEEWNNLDDDEPFDSIEEKRKAKIKEITKYELNDATWRPREIRNKYGWWCVGFYLIGMLDAFVDAHLYYFPADKIELTGQPATGSVGLRLSWNLGGTEW